MAEYIERKTVKELLERYGATDDALALIDSVPAVDAVQVVRCRECKHLMFSDFYGECKRGYLGIVQPDDFCSRGERTEAF